MIPAFDKFIAIDWSGASGRYNGIAVAICNRGRGAPRLVLPQGGPRWTRGEIASWLADQISAPRRSLIGLDFGFGFPFDPGEGYLGGKAPGIDHIFALWSHIETKSGEEPDYGCGVFLKDPECEALFWKSGRKPKGWVERKRLTEYACADATGARPDTLYKLLGSKQVGKASLTGIRVLHHIRNVKRGHAAIWPFETIQTSAIVEIYPTLFRKLATGSIAKLRSQAALNSALERFCSRPVPDSQNNSWSDHETDALISAAGLRSLSPDARVWLAPEVSSVPARREGWIFGVTGGVEECLTERREPIADLQAFG